MIRTPLPGPSRQLQSRRIGPGPSPRKPPIRVHFCCAMPNCTFTCYHYRTMDEHVELQHRCRSCGRNFAEVASHARICPARAGPPQLGRGPPNLDDLASPFVESGRFHLGTILVYEYTPPEVICMVADLFESVAVSIKRLLAELVRHFGGIRVSFRVVADLIEEAKDFRVSGKHIGCSWSIISHVEFIDDAIFNSLTYIVLALNYFNEGSSNFAVERLTRLDIHIGEYSPVSPRGFIPTPICLRYRQTLLNIRGTGSRCFHYCILAHIYGEEMSEAKLVAEMTTGKKKSQSKEARYNRKIRYMSQAKNYNKYFVSSRINFTMIRISTKKGCSMHDIDMFEARNEISVNVFDHVGKNIVPRKLTKSAKEIHVNIMILKKGEESHFILIRDLNRFLGQTGHNGHVFCPQCLKPYIQTFALNKHLEICGTDEVGNLLVPTEDTFRFIKYENTRMNDYCMYFAIQEEEQKKDSGKSYGAFSEGDRGGEKEACLSKLVPIAYALIQIGPGGKLEKEKFGMGKGAMVEFIETALEWALEVREKLKTTNNFIALTPLQKQCHERALICGSCLQEFSKHDPKVLDHCHTSGLYQGAKHQSCNLRIRMPRLVHALTFDSSKQWYRHIICALDSVKYECKVVPTMKSQSELAGIEINGLIRFTNVVNYRPDEKFADLIHDTWEATREFPLFRQCSHPISDDFILNLIDVTPPDVTCTTIEHFIYYNEEQYIKRERLQNTEEKRGASDREFKIYFDYYTKLGCNTIKGYTEKKLTHKAILIAEVMQRIRPVAYKNYGLEILNSWTIASYTFQCAFYFDRLELGIITCPNVAKLADDLIRGGYQVMNKKSVKSNTTMYGDYDKEQPNCIILYSDIVQSYANCMKNYLPNGNYEMMSPAELEGFDFKNPKIDTGVGYCFQVSLILDEKYHDFFSDMPLSPEHYKVFYESEGKDGTGSFSAESKRFLATLLPKEEKTYYYKTLAYMLQSGFELTEVHQGYKFTESKFLESYVNYNTKLRYEATNEMDSRTCKAMVNLLAGKFMVNQTSYPLTQFCFSSVMCKQLLAQDNFVDVLLIDKNVTLFKLKKPSSLDLNFRGTAGVILELGRLELYKLYYQGLKNQFGASLRLIYSNTDSLLCTIKCTESIYLEKMKNLTPIFDFSNLPIHSPLFDESNKNCPGKLKICHKDITEFLGLGISTYSIITESDREDFHVMKCRGIPRPIAKKFLNHANFKAAVERLIERKVEYDTLRVIDNCTFRVKVERCALRNADNSRVFFHNSFSLPYGHYYLKARVAQGINLKSNAEARVCVQKPYIIPNLCN